MAAKLGNAVRAARRELPRNDPHFKRVKEVLVGLGSELRPKAGVPLPQALAEAPKGVNQLTALLESLAVRPKHVGVQLPQALALHNGDGALPTKADPPTHGRRWRPPECLTCAS